MVAHLHVHTGGLDRVELLAEVVVNLGNVRRCITRIHAILSPCGKISQDEVRRTIFILNNGDDTESERISSLHDAGRKVESGHAGGLGQVESEDDVEEVSADGRDLTSIRWLHNLQYNIGKSE